VEEDVSSLSNRSSVRPGATKRNSKDQLSRQVFGFPSHEVQKTSPDARNEAFAETIRAIPRGKVATYGQVAAAAGYPRYHRAVARLLKMMTLGEYPWQRVVGAGGEIKVAGRAAAEQKLRLKMEGVTFAGKRINLSLHQHVFEPE
jgi:methylated-DNA-protein-cysteine methyltransferase-like protein